MERIFQSTPKRILMVQPTFGGGKLGQCASSINCSRLYRLLQMVTVQRFNNWWHKFNICACCWHWIIPQTKSCVQSGQQNIYSKSWSRLQWRYVLSRHPFTIHWVNFFNTAWAFLDSLYLWCLSLDNFCSCVGSAWEQGWLWEFNLSK